jgi:excisionase family DNA binding protein
MERRTFTVEEAGAILGIGRNAAYEAVKTGQVPAIRIGKRLLVPRTELDKLLSRPSNTELDHAGLASEPKS